MEKILKMENHSFPDGLLFHGTIEPFQGSLKASKWEGVLWTSETPDIAQAYCPESGLSAMWAKRREDYEAFIPRSDLDEKLFRDMGYCLEDMDIQKDKYHKMESYRLLKNHPRNIDVCEYVKSLGYEFENDACWIKIDDSEIQEASWKKPGRLFIIEKTPDLRIKDLSETMDGGLTGRQWNNNDLIRSYENDYDAVCISDVHNSPKLGHFEHKSIALFSRALEKLRFHDIRAAHHDPYHSWYGSRNRITPEFESLVNQLLVETQA